MSQFDKRIKVNTVIENHLPEFITSDFPNAVEFFKQYYISQEFQGGASDLIQNFDQYLKVDNLVPEVVNGETNLPVHFLSPSEVTASDTTIEVASYKGFPTEYGLLKINDEIITYTGKNATKTDVATISGNITSQSDTFITGITTTNIAINDLISVSSVQNNSDTILILDGARVTGIGVGKIQLDRQITATSTQTVTVDGVTTTIPRTINTENPVSGVFKFTHERFFFTGCERGFSGITGYNVGVSSSLIDVNREKLKFEKTSAQNHVNGSSVQNLSVLFIQEFYKNLKKTFCLLYTSPSPRDY